MTTKKDQALKDFLLKLKKASGKDQLVIITLAFARSYGQTYPEEADKRLQDLCNNIPLADQHQAALCLARGWIWFDRADFHRAQKLFENSMVFAKQQNSTLDILKAHNGIASCLGVTGKVDEALEIYEQALILAEEIGDQEQQRILSTNIGSILMELGLAEEALEYFSKNLGTGWMDEVNKAINLHQMGLAYTMTGQHDKAEEMLKTALEKTSSQNLPAVHCEVLSGLARLNLDQGKINEARNWLFKTMKVYGAKDNIKIQSLHSYLMGRLHSRDNKPKLARASFQKALEFNKEFNNRSLEIDILTSYAELEKKQGRWKRALELIEECQNQSASLNTIRIRQEISRLTSRQTQKEADLYRTLYKKISAISEVGQLITSNLRLEDIIDTIAAKVQTIMASDIFGLALYDTLNNTIDYKLFIEGNVRSNNSNPIRPVDLQSFAGWSILNKKPVLMGNVLEEYSKYLKKMPGSLSNTDSKKPRAHSVIYSPLIVEDQVLGVISAQSYEIHAYSEQDLEALQALGAYISVALENARLYSEVTKLATTDTLTGALSRHRLFELSETEFARFQRYGNIFSVIMIDLDHFKDINDTFGHNIGDYALQVFSRECMSLKRNLDYFARYGGEEFVLILSDTQLAGASLMAERMRNTIERLAIVLETGEVIQITASFGVTQAKISDKSLDDSLNRADTALYQAKDQGRNRVIVRA